MPGRAWSILVDPGRSGSLLVARALLWVVPGFAWSFLVAPGRAGGFWPLLGLVNGKAGDYPRLRRGNREGGEQEGEV